jgi:hypothetical protein
LCSAQPVFPCGEKLAHLSATTEQPAEPEPEHEQGPNAPLLLQTCAPVLPFGQAHALLWPSTHFAALLPQAAMPTTKNTTTRRTSIIGKHSRTQRAGTTTSSRVATAADPAEPRRSPGGRLHPSPATTSRSRS